MQKQFRTLCLSLLATTCSLSAVAAADEDTLLSVAKPGGQSSAHASVQPKASGDEAAKQSPAASSKPAAAKSPAAAATAGTAATKADTAKSSEAAPSQACDTEAGAAPPASSLLGQAYAAYRANPSAASFAPVLQQFKQLLGQAGMKAPAAALLKANPVLADMGAHAIDAGPGKIWVFNKVPESHEAVIQWADTKATVTYAGRRHRIRRVSYTTTYHVSTLALPPNVTLRDARVLGNAEGAHSVVLVGAENGSNLWLRTYKMAGGNWAETASQLNSIPGFLTTNVSGRVSFRGPDLIFSVARVVSDTVGGAKTSLPEADSSTYKFWLHLTEDGYVLMPHLPDEAQFYVVRQFLDALANNRTDIARSLLTDGRVLSIPKYVGVHAPSNNFHVIQMASPPSGAPRFRLITGGRDDLIFEVVRIKDRPMIRGIFIASPDAFLQEIAKLLPSYDKVAPNPPPTLEQASAEKH